MTEHYDLIAIGGGSGGLAVAETAAQLGKKVAMIDGKPLGGTCVNNGCVPKKIMWYAASLAHDVDDAKGFGVPAQRQKTDWPALVKARQDYIAGLNTYWDGHARELGITHIQGHARFVSTHTIEVDGRQISADHVVIATGSRPFVPAIPGADLGITSDGFFELQQQPRRVAIVGGGYIGVELAGMLHYLGSEVSFVISQDRVIPDFDAMLGEVLTDHMGAEGIDMHLSQYVTRLSQNDDGINLETQDGVSLAGFDTVIWAVGRSPNTEGLQLENTGVEPLSNGSIAVDAYQNTRVDGIYALGDVTAKSPLTPVAIDAGRQLARRLFADQPQSKTDYENIPTVVFAHPPVGSVGMSESEAYHRFGDKVTVYETRFTPMRFSLAPSQSTTAMKLVCVGENEKVVGLHIIGDQADEMIQGFAVAVKMGATKADFDATMAIHPTAAEELVTMKPFMGRKGESDKLHAKRMKKAS